jgi:tRNA threonylcarbamoyladenosine biosynthesis protein TsaB
MDSPPPTPRIVAIETSGRHGSVVVASGPTVLAARELPPTSRHAIELMPAIADLTRAQGWTPQEIDHLYLSLGPGSFTGLRIAVAIARAMHQASGGQLKLVGVPSLDVIAHNAPAEATVVLPILDAKRAQIFSARYERNRATGELTQAAPAGLYDPASFLQKAMGRAEAMGGGSVALLGEGIEYHRAALAVPGVVELPKELWHARAGMVHRLGYARAVAGRFSEAATLLPLYIRLPEAEEVYRKKHGLPLT